MQGRRKASRATRTLIALAAVLGFVWGAPTPASAASTWIPTGSLGSARSHGIGILLHNGRVLVMGSAADGELYDPATGTWSPTGPGRPFRLYGPAVLLRDGRVLTMGGEDGGSFYAECDVYDPVSDTWSSAASMTTPRSRFTATLLNDGRVLATGGENPANTVLSSAEIYDPSLNSWTPTGSLTALKSRHSATLLQDGRVMVTGGVSTGVAITKITEVFDPGAGSWTRVGDAVEFRLYHSATLLRDGNVLAAGGFSRDTAEIFDPGSGSWSPTGSLSGDRYEHSTTLLPNGLVLVAGGYNTAAEATTELYDPTTGLWSAGPMMGNARRRHASTMLPDGRVLVAGGATGPAIATAELFEGDAPGWTAVPNMNVNRNENTATLLKDGRVLVAGGAAEASAEVFDPTVPGWALTGNSMSSQRWRHSATVLLDGRVLVAGSRANTASSRTADVYDPVADTWSKTTGDLAQGRSTHTATLLPDGEVLVAGGQNNSNVVLISAERYDPGSDTWLPTASMGTARWRGAATLLRNGLVLVTGGWNGAALATAEIYNPGTETWTPIAGTMTVPRYWHTSTLLPSGKVLLVGGGELAVDPAATSAELFDPITKTFSATGSPNVAHEADFTTTLLKNGRVLVVGGDTNRQVAEVYDPVSGTFTPVPSNTVAERWAHAAALLPDGSVLLAGSVTAGLTAEFFDVGRGEDPSWRPLLASATDPATNGTQLTVTGTQFQGLSEGSTGYGALHSASNYPLVQLRRVDNEDSRWLSVDPVSEWSDIDFTSVPLAGLAPGPAVVTVFTSGIPSDSRVVTIGCSAPAITTPPTSVDVCEGAPATFTVGTSGIAPSFEWRKDGTPLVDGGAISGSTTATLTIDPTSPADVGNYDVVVSTCSTTTTTTVSVPLTVAPNLSTVMAGLVGDDTVCSSCLGGTFSETHLDGGPVSYQWGFRAVSLGSISPISGQTGASYLLNGSHFPGPGSYLVVVTTTPLCGAAQISNEVPVIITTGAPDGDVTYFTVTSRDQENVLEWVYPGGTLDARIRFNSGPTCTPPTDPSSSGTLLDDVTGTVPLQKDRYSHSLLTNGTSYCYTIFAGPGPWSPGRSNSGRPMDTSGAVKWAFSVGVFSITAPTVGGSGILATTNDPVIHSMERGEDAPGGEWPGPWYPVPVDGAVQSRSPIVPIDVGVANPVGFVGTQGGSLHVLDAVMGGAAAPPWAAVSLTPVIQAAPAGIFTAFGGSYDYLLVGSRVPAADNEVYAVDPLTGALVDAFNNGGGSTGIGMINTMGSVDYANDRFYFTSFERGAPALDTLWCVDLSGLPIPVMTHAWSRPLGDIHSSPVVDGGTVYVGSPLGGGGALYAIDAATGSVGLDRTFGHGDGQVKGFVFPDRGSGDLYFATDNLVWALNDNGTTITNNFPPTGITLDTGVVPTSAVLFVPGSHFFYVGGSDGKLYEIDVSGASPVIRSVVLGDGLSAVGAPSLDWPNDLLVVGTEAGVFYAVAEPFP